MKHTQQLKTIGIILVGLSAILALMAVAMGPSAFGDEDRFITLEQDTGYDGDGIRIVVTESERPDHCEIDSGERGVSHTEYRQSGSFFTPYLVEI